MTSGVTGLPVLVEQVVVQRLHSLQLISLEQSRLVVQAGIGGVGSRNGIEQAAIVIGTQHGGACHFGSDTHRSAVADAGRTHLTFLGSHQDDTVSSTGTVDGSRSILQHRDALHLRGVKVVEGLST